MEGEQSKGKRGGYADRRTELVEESKPRQGSSPSALSRVEAEENGGYGIRISIALCEEGWRRQSPCGVGYVRRLVLALSPSNEIARCTPGSAAGQGKGWSLRLGFEFRHLKAFVFGIRV